MGTETSIKWDRHKNGKLFEQNIAMMIDFGKIIDLKKTRIIYMFGD